MRLNQHKKLTLILFLVFGLSSVSEAQEQHTAMVVLAGYKVSPAVTTPATGTAIVTLEGDSLFVKGNFSDLNSTFRGAGIHYGRKGENGNQVLKFSTILNEKETGGKIIPSSNRFKLTNSLKQSLSKGLLYINIYTQMNPRGELRGQIPPLPG